MWEEDNEFFIARNENIRWAQKLKCQKAVLVNRNEANIRLVNQAETVTALVSTIVSNDMYVHRLIYMVTSYHVFT